MIQRLIVLIALFLFPFIIKAQKVVRTSGSAQFELTEDKSRAQVKKESLDHALINAIERAFGRVVVQGNSTYISNVNTGQEVETNTVFNMIANTSVKGEVEEIIEVKYTDVKGSKSVNGKLTEVIDIRCDVVIKAREIEEAAIEFECATLSCNMKNCATTRFYDGGDLYIYFNSARSGYVTIYLDDTKNTYRLLPYRIMPVKFETGFPVKADMDYILFSDDPQHNYLDIDIDEDNYQLYANSQQDINRIFVIFSYEPINKPRLVEDIDPDNLKQNDIEKGYSSPKALPSEDFQRWLNNIRSFNKDEMQVEIIDITISKR